MTLHSINPATEERVASFDEPDEHAVDRRLTMSAEAALKWRSVPVAERVKLLAAVADTLDARRDDLARLAVREMGKTLRAARDEVAKSALGCRHYAKHAGRILATQAVMDGRETVGHIRHDPLGVLLAIMPWNFPFWQAFRAAAPAMAAGNVVVLKHASNVPACADAIESVIRDAGAPEGLFTTLLVGSSRVASLISDDRVHAVTLTGSEAAGRDVASRAGAALKKCVLELGGSDPFVVLASADVAKAAESAAAARLVNNGQSCIAAKRFIVVEKVAKVFTTAFVERMRAAVVGDPMRDDTQLGPLATRQIRDDLERQVQDTIARGARVLTGGAPRAGAGYFFEPTVLSDVPLDAPAARDELFGPVAPIFVVRDADEALSLANATTFGLGASVWTNDTGESERFGREIAAGLVFTNAVVASDPRLPFGGVKRSGFGRELGDDGMREFVNIKTLRGAVTPAPTRATTE